MGIMSFNEREVSEQLQFEVRALELHPRDVKLTVDGGSRRFTEVEMRFVEATPATVNPTNARALIHFLRTVEARLTDARSSVSEKSCIFLLEPRHVARLFEVLRV